MVFLLMQVNQLCIFIMEMLMYFISDYSNWTKQGTQVKNISLQSADGCIALYPLWRCLYALMVKRCILLKFFILLKKLCSGRHMEATFPACIFCCNPRKLI